MTAAPVLVWAGGVVVSSALFGLSAPAVARRAPARSATWVLSVGSLLVAGSVLVVPALLVLVAAGQIPLLAAVGDWSARRLARLFPLDSALVAVPALMLAAQITVVAVAAVRQLRMLARSWRASRDFDTPLVVLPDGAPLAFALPGRPGRVVVSRTLLRRLDADERRAVLCHEQAHLDCHHEIHRAASAIAAAANPLLRAVPAAVRLASERWADARAALAVGDPRVVASAIGRTALAGEGVAPSPAMAMGAADADVAVRVSALLGAGPARRLCWEALLALGLAVAVGLALIGVYDAHHVFELAQVPGPR